ncbi:SDR family oxidoreductase [Streptomyces sp. NPDC051172]|uniref:SDR family oxidoreductase n=1 Tax=Streptomyces sp. NPDC051172 TaxID=3155796 RepID=UPI003418C6BD
MRTAPRYGPSRYRPAGKLKDKVAGAARGAGAGPALSAAARRPDIKLELEQLTAEVFDRTLKVNRYAIIATATEEALKGSETVIDYAASKAALITWTRSVAIHLARRGVRANVVAPGTTWTPLNEADRYMPPDGLAHIGSDAPLGRAAQPEEIAPTCGMVETE